MSSTTGRHRAPSTSNTGRLVAVSVAAIGMALSSAGIASAAPSLDSIAHCESSGNARATNGSHFGLFQFDLATWRSVGGKGNPMDASVDTQYALAQKLLSQRGTQPWNASKGCWGSGDKKVVIKNGSPSKQADKKPARVAPKTTHKAVPKSTEKLAPKTMKPRAAGRHAVVNNGDYTVIAGDTLSKIAARQNVPGGWRALFEKNSGKVKNPNLIFVGQQLGT